MQRPVIAHISRIVDPLNYYIMVEDPTFLEARDVLKVRVVYTDVIYNGGIPVVNSPEKRGFAYKARLEGLIFPSSFSHDMREGHGVPKFRKKGKDSYKLNPAKLYVSQFLKQSEMWVTVELVDVDKYKRVIIRISDPITGISLNDKLREQFRHIFNPFFGRNRRI